MLRVANAKVKLMFSDGQVEAPLWPLYINSPVLRAFVSETTESELDGDEPLVIACDGGTCRAFAAKEALTWIGKEAKIHREIANVEIEEAKALRRNGKLVYAASPRLAADTLSFLRDDVVADTLKFFDHFQLENLLEPCLELINLRASPCQIAAVDAIRPVDPSWASCHVIATMASLLKRFINDMERSLHLPLTTRVNSM